MTKTLLAATLLAAALTLPAGCADEENKEREVQRRVAATLTAAH